MEYSEYNRLLHDHTHKINPMYFDTCHQDAGRNAKPVARTQIALYITSEARCYIQSSLKQIVLLSFSGHDRNRFAGITKRISTAVCNKVGI
ncbi:hypothetical protein AG1IA_05028 [Rhizoctonia solani AG-1 IA]|uniref:Uncharacterized protein n=1 Tax=Thanatephorus cucumeris (strain AG1-IA) TaxID=983506 RepID=L8WVY1_THACA|nr:hypothetical protein AG1IA_05028 [Rhizoctonia solani AG-1 IA]